MIYADHSILALVNDWRQRRSGEVFMEWDVFTERVNTKVSLSNHGILPAGAADGRGLMAARGTAMFTVSAVQPASTGAGVVAR